MGKTIADSEAEIVRGLDSVQSACSIGHEMVGMCNMSETTQSYTISEPLVNEAHVPCKKKKKRLAQLTNSRPDAGRLCVDNPV